jgi:hypothetical protein
MREKSLTLPIAPETSAANWLHQLEGKPHCLLERETRASSGPSGTTREELLGRRTQDLKMHDHVNKKDIILVVVEEQLVLP